MSAHVVPSATVANVQPGSWARRTSANVRAELARHSLERVWLAGQLAMNPQTLSQRLKADGLQTLDVEEVGRIAEAIAAHVGLPVEDIAARLWP